MATTENLNPATETATVKKGFSPKRRYATDVVAELKGKWFDYVDGARLLVARVGNDEHLKIERALESRNAHRLEKADEVAKGKIRAEINREAFARTVLLGWENILDENGNELPYSVEAALDLLQYPEFFGEVAEFGVEAENFRQFQEERAVKN